MTDFSVEFNKLAMDKEFNPQVKSGSKMECLSKKRGTQDKKTYKIAKPDIEHDNIEAEDLTSDSSSDDE